MDEAIIVDKINDDILQSLSFQANNNDKSWKKYFAILYQYYPVLLTVCSHDMTYLQLQFKHHIHFNIIMHV